MYTIDEFNYLITDMNLVNTIKILNIIKLRTDTNDKNNIIRECDYLIEDLNKMLNSDFFVSSSNIDLYVNIEHLSEKLKYNFEFVLLLLREDNILFLNDVEFVSKNVIKILINDLINLNQYKTYVDFYLKSYKILKPNTKDKLSELLQVVTVRYNDKNDLEEYNNYYDKVIDQLKKSK